MHINLVSKSHPHTPLTMYYIRSFLYNMINLSSVLLYFTLSVLVTLRTNQRKGENGRRMFFMTKSQRKNVLPDVRIEPALFDTDNAANYLSHCLYTKCNIMYMKWFYTYLCHSMHVCVHSCACAHACVCDGGGGVDFISSWQFTTEQWNWQAMHTRWTV